jgi:hypothetical protein
VIIKNNQLAGELTQKFSMLVGISEVSKSYHQPHFGIGSIPTAEEGVERFR